MKKHIVAVLFLLCSAGLSFAQDNTRYSRISGKVTDTATGEPIAYAAVLIESYGIGEFTDVDGYFNLESIPVGKMKLSVSFFGMEQYDTTFVAKAAVHYKLDIKMHETNFRLNDVVVTAKKSEAGASTASEISRQAMDHMQTSSLKDVMALLPGVSLSNPSLSNAQTITIRNNAGTSAMNSLGTVVFVDGSPMSNNANLQVLSTAQGGSTTTSAGGGSASSGVDIRGLSTDNIESVEVIRGIPSAQYGDLTSGAVIVKSRAGESPLTVRFKTNPNIYQASLAKGFKLSKKLGNLNVSADYAYNRSSLTEAFNHYQRASAKVLWSVRPAQIINTNTALTFNYGKDEKEWNQDLAMDKSMSHATDIGFVLNTNGTASINGEWLKSINWAISGTYTDKVSHYENTASNALNLYSTSMVNGQTYTQTPGQKLYDFVTGEEITNASETGVKGTILPYSYYYMYDVFGKEINGFAKLNAEFSHTWGGFTDKLLVGGDIRTDGNLGKGSVYDDQTPPWRDIGNVNSGYRKRPYYDIPFVNQFSGYVEDHAIYHLGERTFNLTAGARYLLINSGETTMSSVDPRVNASLDVFPWMTLRAGWGYASKAPTSIYLNPNYAYLDEVKYNGMGTNIPEAERLLLATTHVYDAHNYDLQIARNRKIELGLDLMIADRYSVSITGYDELMTNGYSFGLQPDSFVYFIHQAYVVANQNPGAIPDLTAGPTTRSFFQVYKPGNRVAAHNYGIEYEVDLGRFDAIRTSFYLNGAWATGCSWTNGYTYNTSAPSSATRTEFNIAMYEPGRVKSWNEDHITTLRATHNIPEIGFVVTLTAQAHWYAKYWSQYDRSRTATVDGKVYDTFSKYLSYETGKIEDITFSEALLSDDDFSYLLSPTTDARYRVEKYIPYTILNLNLSKEIGDNITASFYVNNIFNSRPLYTDPISGGKVELGIPMFFGFEFKVNIR